MALHIYKISEYDHAAEKRQFYDICNMLRQAYADKAGDCIFIGNCNIEGVELDALLVTRGGIRILEFKNWGGSIVARENGDWKSDGMIIEGGAGGKTPYGQIRLNRSRAARGLTRLLGVAPADISAAIVFAKNAEIDTLQLSDTVKTWLTVCDNAHLDAVLRGLDAPKLSRELLLSIPRKLRIEEFGTGNSRVSSAVINATYRPRAAADFFKDLETAVGLMPDYRRVYKALNDVFQQFINEQTNRTRLNLGGPFAKTDYLLKEHKATGRLAATTNETRVRLRKHGEMSERDMEKFCLFDLKNLCRFIAFVCKCDIPGPLVAMLPTEKSPSFAHRLVGECMRVIVERWDDDYVYVQTEEGFGEEAAKVCYSRGNAVYDYGWSYLKDLFYKGAQLNLVRPREDNGIIYPELTIFEPDYLVNISSVARCFTSYADSPFVELIKKLEPSAPTEPTVLGNLAGQLLDETIHQLPGTHSYAQSARLFFENNAMSLLSADVGREFHINAHSQKKNIQHALNEVLPGALNRFNSKEGFVEPTFFSEMLGLQGRMDYLQLDFKVLLEQKSGKGAYPYDNFTVPRRTDEHYVQLLLYMALIRYNYQEIYDRNGKELHAFLLYSKYKESLLGLGFAPELLFKAIKVRNGIARAGIMYAQSDGFRLLDILTPEKLNEKHADNALWYRWQKPKIEAVLNPVHNATELERAYYFRFLTFIANEHLMSKIGNKTKNNSGFASTWHDSLEDKLAAGNIYDKLALESPAPGDRGRVENIILRFSETDDNSMSNFRIGDAVILYPYGRGTEPDARRTMVFRCAIEDIHTDRIYLALRNAQSDNRVFVKEQGKLWAIEHDFADSSYDSLYRGMQAFLSAPRRRRDLILFRREPETDGGAELKGDYGDFNELSLRVKRAKDIFLIIGPPGTGKTSYGLLNTVKEELLEAGSNILLLSYTNRAVDEICSKMVKEGIDFVRIGSKLSCAPEYRDRLLNSIARKEKNMDTFKAILSSVRVFVGTTSSLNGNLPLFKLKQFSLAVVDEASQILEPHLMPLLSAHNDGTPAIRKFVFIGDHKQLPAVVQQQPEISRVHDAALNDIFLTDCRLSLFERLLKRYAGNEAVVYMLRKQGRMHRDIARFPNRAFYNGRLTEVPLDHQTVALPLAGLGKNGIDDMLATRRVAFVASETPRDSTIDKVNQNEAEIIAALVMRIYAREKNQGFDVNGTVGVIVPYRNQIAAVRKTIDRYGVKLLHDITIDTVERYQGSQRKYIIYGFTIQKYYQLNFLTNNVFRDIDGSIVDRKLNVAMTRAEEHLIMVGNPELLSNNLTFRKLIEFVKARHGYFDVKADDFVRGDFAVPQYAAED